MKTVQMIDMTLKTAEVQKDGTLTFKETIEIARGLDRLQMDAIELPEMQGGKADLLVRKTIASMVSSALSVPVALEDDAVQARESIRDARHPRLSIPVPCSPVQMEYSAHKKAPALLEAVKKQVAACRAVCEDVEIIALDATRAEKDFLCQVIEAAIECGAGAVTLCDTAGIMMPEEMAVFMQEIREHVPQSAKVLWFVQTGNTMHMAAACAAACMAAGADGVKCTAIHAETATLEYLADFIRTRGHDMSLTTRVRVTELGRIADQISRLIHASRSEQTQFEHPLMNETAGICLDANDEIREVLKVVSQLGYDLSDEDGARVYEEFRRVAEKKHFVGTKELDAIVASTAMQVPSTYRIESYVINSGNVITATANLTLDKQGTKLRGVSVGDGPIDAAFLAIEQIIGHHYELDDFQIQAVTEGREAMGSALVRLRSGGKLYSGNGISTDIIGASIRAYISALNKIVYEEA